jgi:tetratricopeptide (TPR) repeat protein
MIRLQGVVIVLAVAVITPAFAAGDTGISPEAKRHVDVAVQHYEAQRWKEASEEFELAYRLSHKPALLFNIARCEAKLGHDEAAIAFLRKYLEERPDAPDTASVLAEIEAREEALANAKGKAQAEAEAQAAKKRTAELQLEQARRDEERMRAEAAAQAVTKPAPPKLVLSGAEGPESPAKKAYRNAGIALLVVGPAVAAIGIGLGVAAHNAANDIMGLNNQPFSMTGAGIESRGKAMDSSGIALDVIGGAATAVGATLLGVSYRGKF